MTQVLATTNQALSFPKPTGDYAVGTTSYDFVDPEREEIYTEDSNDKREITAKVWGWVLDLMSLILLSKKIMY